MNPATRTIETLRVESPCPAAWAGMEGDDRKRFCALCKLHVYDFTAMSEAESEAVLTEHSGKRLCGRIYERPDGKSLLSDCGPVRRSRARRLAAAGWGVALLLVASSAAAFRGEFQRAAAEKIRDTPLYNIPVVARFVDAITPRYYITGIMVCPAPSRTPGQTAAAGNSNSVAAAEDPDGS